MGIIEFLEARIAEDEARASSGWARLGDSRWETDNYGRDFLTPSAVVAECAAKRALIDQQYEYLAVIDAEWACCHTAAAIRSGECRIYDNPVRDTPILVTLAAVYKGHPEYKAEWTP